jgi:DNA adenine methylase
VNAPVAAPTLTPLCRWVGGKRNLAPLIAQQLPAKMDVYVEPFCGAAAVFGAVYWRAGMSVLADLNLPLVNTLMRVRQDPLSIRGDLQRMAATYAALDYEGREAMYYATREAWNLGAQLPAMFLFLKATSFNGLWRVSGKTGRMNAAFGKLEQPKFVPEHLDEWSRALAAATLVPGDYKQALVGVREHLARGAKVGLYFDPPYLGTFDSYTQGYFDDAQRVELLTTCWDLCRRGARVVYTDSIEAQPLVGACWPGSSITPIDDSNRINVDPNGRQSAEAILVVGGPS